MSCEYLELAEELLKLRQEHDQSSVDPSFMQIVIERGCSLKTNEIIEQTINDPEAIKHQLRMIQTKNPSLSSPEIVDTYISREFIMPGLYSARFLYFHDRFRDFITLYDLMYGATITGMTLFNAAGKLEHSDSTLTDVASKVGLDKISESAQVYTSLLNMIESRKRRFQEDGIGFRVLDDYLSFFEDRPILIAPEPIIPELNLAGIKSYVGLYKALYPLAPASNIPTLQ